MVTVEELKKLEYGDILYDKVYTNADGTPQRWRVNGKPKIWKTRPNEVRVPVKRGLYQYGYIDQYNANAFTLEESHAL